MELQTRLRGHSSCDIRGDSNVEDAKTRSECCVRLGSVQWACLSLSLARRLLLMRVLTGVKSARVEGGWHLWTWVVLGNGLPTSELCFVWGQCAGGLLLKQTRVVRIGTPPIFQPCTILCRAASIQSTTLPAGCQHRYSEPNPCH